MRHQLTTAQAAEILALYDEKRHTYGAIVITDRPNAGIHWRWRSDPPDKVTGRACMIETCEHTHLDTNQPEVLAEEINKVMNEATA